LAAGNSRRLVTLAHFKVQVLLRCTADWAALAKADIVAATENVPAFDGMQAPALQPFKDYEDEPLRVGEIEWLNLVLAWPDVPAQNTSDAVERTWHEVLSVVPLLRGAPSLGIGVLPIGNIAAKPA
jgi:hypothetical protein